jgi:hypothetical protein
MPNYVEQIDRDVEAINAPAAYIAFRTFLGAIDALQHGVPKKLDRTIWRNQSGVVQSQIMMAFRFFGLVDAEDRPTPALERLVDHPEKRVEHIAALLQHGYRDLIAHDLTKMSPKMLEQAMEQYNVSGDTRRKAITFFLQAARFAELPMHPLLSAQIRSAAPSKRRRKAREGNSRPETPLSQLGTSKVILLDSGGTLTLSVAADVFSMSAEDRSFVFGLIDELQKYEKGAEK